jgi:hypothetical protein|eukprot:5174699-Prymnesium_polylepis.2
MALFCTVLLLPALVHGFDAVGQLPLATWRRAPPPSAALREPTAPEDKALRKARLGFGYDGPYFSAGFEPLVERTPPDIWAQLRQDHPALSSWSDVELAEFITQMRSTPLEILVATPIGPFLFFSGIALLQKEGILPPPPQIFG